MRRTIEKTLGDIRISDGAAYMIKANAATWLLTDIIAYQEIPDVANIPLQSWTLSVNDDQTGRLVCYKGGDQTAVFEQGLMFTNFPAGTFELLVVDGTIILPEEYELVSYQNNELV